MRLIQAVAIGLTLGAMPGCASRTALPETCRLAAFAEMRHTTGDPRVPACTVALMNDPSATLAGVQQTGGQTRTVGVPRSFLVTLLVLILVLSLA
ncbi:MAG TPA: hypothetical protein VLD39_07135 [Gammaproteobacteria bacterium]|nr:hypothetical protein [Gammaproteobacteria bacterium]